MSYNSAINQTVRDQIFFENTSAINQPITQTNLSLIANLQYVQDWIGQIFKPFMTIINPYFTGLMTGSNINLSGYLSVPTIQNQTNFLSIPTIEINSIKYNISSVPSGTIKMLINNSNPPIGFLLCDGSSYLISDYQDLFNLIGYTYSDGGSGSYFNVPNFNSYFPIGANNQNNLGCALSNFVSGNNAQGANNNYLVSSNFGGNSSSVPPLLQQVPPHTHSITDDGHNHLSGVGASELPYIPIPPVGTYIIEPFIGGLNTGTSVTNIIINDTGNNIQSIDSNTGLNGVNISPPYLSVFFYIAI
jgi:microcystin-dependent protein